MHDIIIVGAGPAGLTAALYARRAGKTVLLIEKETFGGQITLSPNVENYPFTHPMSGVELANTLVEQAISLGAEFEVDNVNAVSREPDGTLTVKTDYSTFSGRSLIIATGLKHRRLGVDGEDAFVGNGISFCAVCDGAFFKNRSVAVVGGGNTAVQDAIYLSKLCSEVYLIHRRDEFRAEKRVAEGLNACTNIHLVLNSVVTSLKGEHRLEAVEVLNRVTNEKQEIAIDGMFVAVGQEPNNAAFRHLLTLDDGGFAVADESCTTALPNVFVAGDCRTKTVRQLTTASADGSVAALAACQYIDAAEQTA